MKSGERTRLVGVYSVHYGTRAHAVACVAKCACCFIILVGIALIGVSAGGKEGATIADNSRFSTAQAQQPQRAPTVQEQLDATRDAKAKVEGARPTHYVDMRSQ